MTLHHKFALNVNKALDPIPMRCSLNRMLWFNKIVEPKPIKNSFSSIAEAWRLFKLITFLLYAFCYLTNRIPNLVRHMVDGSFLKVICPALSQSRAQVSVINGPMEPERL